MLVYLAAELWPAESALLLGFLLPAKCIEPISRTSKEETKVAANLMTASRQEMQHSCATPAYHEAVSEHACNQKIAHL